MLTKVLLPVPKQLMPLLSLSKMTVQLKLSLKKLKTTRNKSLLHCKLHERGDFPAFVSQQIV